MIMEGIRNEMWLDFYKMKSGFIYLNLSMFATVGNRNMMDLLFCLGWISILEAGIGIYQLDLSLIHKHVPTLHHFPCVLQVHLLLSMPPCYLSFLTYILLPVCRPPSLFPFAALSVLSHTFSLSVSFWFSLWSLSSWACLGGGLATASQAAVCCWSCATTEALWLTRYLFV